MLPAQLKKLRPKIIGLLGLGILLVGLLAEYGISLLASEIKRYDQLIQQEVAATNLADKINLNFKRQVQEWKNVLLRGEDQAKRDKYWSSFQTYHKQIQLDVDAYLALPLDNNLKQIMQDFKHTHQQLLKSYQNGFQVFQQAGFNHTAGDKAVAGIDREPTAQLEQLSEQLNNYIITRSKETSEASQSAERISAIGLLIAIVVVTSLTAWFMNAKVVKPLTTLITHLRDVSNGKLDKQVLVYSEDEIGQMSKAIEILRQNTLNICEGLDSTQKDLDKVCYSLVDSAGAISQGVTEQNHGTNSVQISVQGMVDTGQTIAADAHKAADSARQANQAADDSIQAMQHTIEAITASSNQIQDTAEVITKLDEDARKIGSVLDVIKGIAEQTNLLALNAAIEAARAGEQGRGFAVVADEVRTLAARTQKSTEEIQQMIANVQRGANSAVSAIQQGQERTSQSVDKVHAANSQLQDVTSTVNLIAQLNDQIVQSAGQQAVISERALANLSELLDIAKLNGVHADSCAEDNQTLLEVKNRMAAVIARLTNQAAR
ncbi:methyl-accepting chemotaxis protein [Bowmanella sp. Y26]|uniref:methyl-accepting chemotaxis protein n=1 Tax=Bowmanella yangjiangensis TaxID=2811230 RepID=UPI001BDBB697|nr:methyl-accepting chemotaxis protein [Bowmanella yangjiangensis]MBT1062788.1 methyl-accepting chemotaxis protein [Bowmanella yangjiangensis]